MLWLGTLTTDSYRSLLAMPSMRHVVTSLFLARTAQAMVRVALILFTLAVFTSPSLAGIVALASFLPGIIASPLAGAWIDRYGTVRLIGLDYVVAMTTLLAIGGLTVAGSLTPEALVVISVVFSLSAPLSVAGLRSLLPVLTPARLWERANAFDSYGLVFATMFGPLLASVSIAVFGPGPAMIVMSPVYVAAILVLRGVREPRRERTSDSSVLRGARAGLAYVWSNPTLRGLAISVAAYTVSNGVIALVIPLIVVAHLGIAEIGVGIAFGLLGVAGFVSVSLFGRMDSRGRERSMLVVPMLATAPLIALIAIPAGPLGTEDPVFAFVVVCAALVGIGFLEGPINIGMFTVRQRRTHPGWFGRAFAISMAINAVGYPLGAAAAGMVAEDSLEGAVAIGSAACVVAAVLATILVPRWGGADGSPSLTA